ncbi:LysR family transcriptional regulator [Paracoccus sp. (in: a-proteobacteria)]|uniref:LysR family transcriptional regulator n=1 Tax=Paracoccus sp. TaxID=267 RepID=UPI003A8C885D
MKLESAHLEILSAVVEFGGLTEGAAAISKSQPSVSRTMALLEARVGAPLFEPGRRPLRPTELGRHLARLGKTIRTSGIEASRLVDDYRKGRVGRLHISGTPIFMDGVIARMIGEFQAQSPEISIEQSYGYVDELLAQLRNESLDLAVVPLRQDQLTNDLEFAPLILGRNVIACRKGHPLTRTKMITAADLSSYRWVAPPENSPLFRDIQRTLGQFGLDDMPVAFSGGTYASIVGVLAGSDALTVLPASVVVVAGQSSALTTLPLRIEHPDRTLGLLSRPGGEPSLKRLKEFLIAQCGWIDAKLRHGNAEARWRR